MRVPVLIVLAITIIGLLSIIGAFYLYVYGGLLPSRELRRGSNVAEVQLCLCPITVAVSY